MKLGEERLLLDVLEIRAMLLGENYGLTKRDVEWLKELSNGAQTKSLVTDEISERGVQNRLIKIKALLRAENIAQAVAEALRRGIIQ